MKKNRIFSQIIVPVFTVSKTNRFLRTLENVSTNLTNKIGMTSSTEHPVCINGSVDLGRHITSNGLMRVTSKCACVI